MEEFYPRVVKTPMEIEKLVKSAEEKGKKMAFMKSLMRKLGYAFVALLILLGPVIMLSAYEAHVINITARICIPFDPRTPGYWKTHPEVYGPLLPQPLGCRWVETVEDAFDILDSNAQDMRSKLESHLLAMRFNIAHFGVGPYVPDSCGAEGRTIDQLVLEADALLCDPETKRKDLEDMKDILDCTNNLGGGEIRTCLGFLPVIPASFSSISNEVLLMTSEGEIIETEAPAEGEAPIEVTPPSEETPTTETPILEEIGNVIEDIVEPIIDALTPPTGESPVEESAPTPESEPAPEPAPPVTETNTTTNESTTPTE